ncbi:hypothetical protein [Amnibacterium sp.]|uniref:hypothetical protein n=1 Tax=Amnibacterium sp. TaxID=1872496 RepID=UPI003F7BF162
MTGSVRAATTRSPLQRLARSTLLVVAAFIAVTAAAGGVALIVGSGLPDGSTVLVPPRSYLAGSPFGGYLVPGLTLLVVIGGLHAAAFVLVSRRRPLGPLVAALAGFATLVWIFVELLVIPFSALQVVYELLGIVELAALLVLLGLLDPIEAGRERS